MKLETDEALKIHIEGLQATLTKRNARIAELEAKLAKPVDLPDEIKKLTDKAYKQGWQACAGHLAETTRNMATELSKVRKEAMSLYLKERI